jgi:hypothetical protein
MDKAVIEWINSKKQGVRRQYAERWQLWVEYCRMKGLPDSGKAQLEDMKKRRVSRDNSVKFFYDSEVPKFFR